MARLARYNNTRQLQHHNVTNQKETSRAQDAHTIAANIFLFACFLAARLQIPSTFNVSLHSTMHKAANKLAD
jgi:hypothetical protein